MRCEDCGCGMSGGFCSNCHEEVFIAEQYSDMGEEVPASIAIKASAQMNDEDRIERAKKHREVEREKIREEHFSVYNEYPK